jgi:hypothetical protein
VLVTAERAELKAQATGSSMAVGPLPKNERAELLAKRGGWYRLRYDGKEGYAPVDAVIPAYFFADERTKLEYDPLYNPDQYVYVMNSSWMMPAESDKKNASLMSFMLQNDAKFDMTDLKITATLKDEAGQIVEEKEVAVEGVMRANGSEMVGSLLPVRGDSNPPRILLSSDFEKLVAADPKAVERWVDGVEVILPSNKVTEASVTLVEVRAVPPNK